jgi:hypothetical protein
VLKRGHVNRLSIGDDAVTVEMIALSISFKEKEE